MIALYERGQLCDGNLHLEKGGVLYVQGCPFSIGAGVACGYACPHFSEPHSITLKRPEGEIHGMSIRICHGTEIIVKKLEITSECNEGKDEHSIPQN